MSNEFLASHLREICVHIYGGYSIAYVLAMSTWINSVTDINSEKYRT